MEKFLSAIRSIKFGVILILGSFVVFTTACDEKSTSPGDNKGNEESIPPCVQYNTATITFGNESAHSTYDVILDGARIGAISPGQTISRTVAAGEHVYRFKFSNTGYSACTDGTPNLATCEHAHYSCSSDQ